MEAVKYVADLCLAGEGASKGDAGNLGRFNGVAIGDLYGGTMGGSADVEAMRCGVLVEVVAGSTGVYDGGVVCLRLVFGWD